MHAARRVKSAREIERIRAAISVAEDALRESLSRLCAPGVREVELKGVFEERMCRGRDDARVRRRVLRRRRRRAAPPSRLRPRRRRRRPRRNRARACCSTGGKDRCARTWPCGAPTAERGDRQSRWRPSVAAPRRPVSGRRPRRRPSSDGGRVRPRRRPRLRGAGGRRHARAGDGRRARARVRTASSAPTCC